MGWDISSQEKINKKLGEIRLNINGFYQYLNFLEIIKIDEYFPLKNFYNGEISFKKDDVKFSEKLKEALKPTTEQLELCNPFNENYDKYKLNYMPDEMITEKQLEIIRSTTKKWWLEVSFAFINIIEKTKKPLYWG